MKKEAKGTPIVISEYITEKDIKIFFILLFLLPLKTKDNQILFLKRFMISYTFHITPIFKLSISYDILFEL